MESIETFNINKVEDVWNLFSVYEQIPESILGFRFSIARRLITLALEIGVDCAFEMVLRLRKSARLSRKMIYVLEQFVDASGNPTEAAFWKVLSMAENRFARLLSREATRMNLAREDPCIIRNTVRLFTCLTYCCIRSCLSVAWLCD